MFKHKAAMKINERIRLHKENLCLSDLVTNALAEIEFSVSQNIRYFFLYIHTIKHIFIYKFDHKKMNFTY